MGVQVMKYTELMDKIDEKFKERDYKIDVIVEGLLNHFDQLSKIKSHLESIDQTLDELTEETEDDECEDCKKDCVQCNQETIESIITNFHAELRKALTKA